MAEGPEKILEKAMDKFLKGFQKFQKWITWVNRTSGILLVAIGIILDRITGVAFKHFLKHPELAQL